MEELREIIRRLAADPGASPSPSEAAALRGAVERHPYFSAAAVMLVASGACRDEVMEQLISLQVSNPEVLGFAGAGRSWAAFYPPLEELGKKRTEDVIDVFLKTYGHSSPEEDRLLERMIFNPAPDYGEMLAREEQENLPAAPADPASAEGRIDAFILGHHPAAPQNRDTGHEPVREHKPISKPEATDDSLLSESLAKVYIRQKRYERAYDIICSLNLKYPKKSAYFADQMRFLQKVIANARFLEQQNQKAQTDKEQ